MKTLQASIIKRFYDDKTFKDFVQEYNDHKYRDTYHRLVNDRDLNILIEYKKGASQRELSKKYKCSITRINTSLRLAALSKLK